MNKHWLLGFLFIVHRENKDPDLYFACFQHGQNPDKAHQIVVADCKRGTIVSRKVAYIVNPSSVESLDQGTLETLCRVAVTQFLGKPPLDNFLAQVLTLDLAGEPWSGPIIPVNPTSPEESIDAARESDRFTIGMDGDSDASAIRHSCSL